MLDRLQIPRLDARRKALRLCLLYKLIDRNNSIPQITPINWQSRPYETRYTHSRQLSNLTGHSSQFLNSFFPCTINEWNNLSSDIIVSCTNIRQNYISLWTFFYLVWRSLKNKKKVADALLRERPQICMTQDSYYPRAREYPV